MAQQTINNGTVVDDPTAEAIVSAFTKINAMTLELFTAFSLGGRQAIDLDATPDTIRQAFIKTNTNIAALYTDQSLPGVPIIDVGDASDDPVPTAEMIYTAFTKVNTAMAALYAIEEPPPAADFYVATTGNDGNAGTIGSPFRTVGKGASMLTPGKTLHVRGGTYAEALINNVPSGTSWGSPVRIHAYPGETVWLKPTSGVRVIGFSGNQRYIEFDGINLNGTLISSDIVKIEDQLSGSAHHIRMKNAEILGSAGTTSSPIRQHVLLTASATSSHIGGNEFINMTLHGHGRADFDHGFYVQSDDNVFDGCEVYDCWGAGFHIYDVESPYPARTIVRNCIVRDGQQHTTTTQKGWGIVAFGNDHLFYNNLIWNIRNTGSGPSAGIRVSNGTGARIFNNTIYGCRCYGIVIRSNASGVLTRNNICYQNTQGNYYVESGGSGTLLTNLFGTDPLFVNAAGDNFHLQAGSPAIGAGTAQAVVTDDFDGVTRGTPPDIGAYEFV